MFEPYGSVESVLMVTDRNTGRSRGFAFVEMADNGAADQAITALNGKDLGGRIADRERGASEDGAPAAARAAAADGAMTTAAMPVSRGNLAGKSRGYDPTSTIGMVGAADPPSGSMVTAKVLASTPADMGGIITMALPLGSGLNMPAGMGLSPCMGTSHSS